IAGIDAGGSAERRAAIAVDVASDAELHIFSVQEKIHPVSAAFDTPKIAAALRDVGACGRGSKQRATGRADETISVYANFRPVLKQDTAGASRSWDSGETEDMRCAGADLEIRKAIGKEAVSGTTEDLIAFIAAGEGCAGRCA